MIFAQYKHAITFALAIMALAVVVADPGSEDAEDPAAPETAVARPASQDRPVPAVAAADPEWYGATADEAEPAVIPEDVAAVDGAQDGEYDIAPAPTAATPPNSRPTAASAPAAQAATYVAPPPPPQNFQP